jgi:hypothetical protein
MENVLLIASTATLLIAIWLPSHHKPLSAWAVPTGMAFKNRIKAASLIDLLSILTTSLLCIYSWYRLNASITQNNRKF